MKNLNLISIVRFTFIAGVVAIGSFAPTTSAVAQSGATVAIVNVPFDFQAANQKMFAGPYRISYESGNLLLLRGPNQAAFVQTHAVLKAKAPHTGYALFNRIGDTYFLSGVWTADANDGVECFPSHAEKEMLKATRKPASGQIKLALNSRP